jgi:signal peptidase II
LRKYWLVALALLVFGLDFFSKSYVHQTIPLASYSYPYGGIGVFQDFYGIEFSIVHVINTGAAWGFLSSMQDYLPYLRLLIVGSMLVYLFFFKAKKSLQVPFVLIIAGALGNICDYFLYGHVVDMFHFKFWGHVYPIFNVADSAIFCGIVWLMLQSFFKKRANNEHSTLSS